jgi:hypothetical protein
MLHTLSFHDAYPTTLDLVVRDPSRSPKSLAAANDKIGNRAIAAVIAAMSLSRQNQSERAESTRESRSNGIGIRAVAGALAAMKFSA